MNKTIKQAVAPKTKAFGKEAFNKSKDTVIRWLGNAGVMINSRGTCIMIDPLLKGLDMPLLIDMPISVEEISHLDGILITHCDNDHFSRVTCRELSEVCNSYHGPHYVAELMREEGLKGIGHNIEETFKIGDMDITLTPADHAWQNESSKYSKIRKFNFEDYCGFWIETKDGTIWAPGDSRLLEEHLNMKNPDVIIFDFSNNSWHIGLEDAIKLANAYPDAKLILSHWGSVDAPEMDAFNADPAALIGKVINEDRIYIMAPGEAFKL
ncbi:MBL fold metallo-hydrolase [Clostridium disporicum]|uniref:MBL fold metallo-hydrolase n=1 Tax=Clostridium disporicum TaxID=84024 RepID=UPI0034A1BDE2